MKTILFTILLCLLFVNSYAQPVKIYNHEADVTTDISQALIRAKAEKKHVFLQVGGNWCPWCLKFHKLWADDPDISVMMGKNYIPVLVNYSKENRNFALLKKLEYPQRFGFPVFVILDSGGNRIHTQSSGYLEDGDGYSKKKVLEFLSQWSPDALDPGNYKEK